MNYKRIEEARYEPGEGTVFDFFVILGLDADGNPAEWFALVLEDAVDFALEKTREEHPDCVAVPIRLLCPQVPDGVPAHNLAAVAEVELKQISYSIFDGGKPAATRDARCPQ
ncbi:hypothetical protein [Rosistilla oblonga]|uniref:hypothetical protein n=1 Tax=Rosistilla oblonga TaxID=2527990 RepID=UPI003A9754F4